MFVQFILKDKTDAKKIIAKYDKQICLVNPDPNTWGKLPKYCILDKKVLPGRRAATLSP